MSSVVVEIWGRRSIVLAAFGLVGIGAVLGGATVYFFYVRHKIEEHFLALETGITTELHQLKKKVGQLQTYVDELGPSPSTISLLKRPSQRVNAGYETGDEVYVTASSDSEDERPLIVMKRKTSTKEGDGGRHTGDGTETEEKRFYSQIDSLLDGNAASQRNAYLSLKTNQEKFKSSGEFWWRLAKATHVEANSGTPDQKKMLSFAAFEHADRSLKLNGNSSEAHKWYAITIGSKGEYLPISEKIKNGFTFKEHIDKAVELNPNDSTLFHLLGRFCYEVATLSWIERRLAATLFSAPPTATPQEALNNFHTCEKLAKPFKENRLFIAKAYIALGDDKKAAYWLNAASGLPINSGSDRLAQVEITKLLPKYRKYLN